MEGILNAIIVCFIMMCMKRIRARKQRRDALLRRKAFMRRIKMERRRRMTNWYKNYRTIIIIKNSLLILL